MKLAGQIAVVTGAGRGIGRAIALAQAREGAKVALLARTKSEIESVAEAIAAEGGIARAFEVDIVDLDRVVKTFASNRRRSRPGQPAHQQRWLVRHDRPDLGGRAGGLVA